MSVFTGLSEIGIPLPLWTQSASSRASTPTTIQSLERWLSKHKTITIAAVCILGSIGLFHFGPPLKKGRWRRFEKRYGEGRRLGGGSENTAVRKHHENIDENNRQQEQARSESSEENEESFETSYGEGQRLGGGESVGEDEPASGTPSKPQAPLKSPLPPRSSLKDDLKVQRARTQNNVLQRVVKDRQAERELDRQRELLTYN